jgi:hypothetical protein
MVSVSAQAITGMRSKETERGVRHFHDNYRRDRPRSPGVAMA